ncbi:MULTISPECIES: flagellar hook assembly protein FlgD [Cohaesibacter]|uniref:flagellar hook assembly protein FlgD n=1 Tax=Cohaesibacter TaxID=655352 RepID=UPI000DE904EB|nr:MULTISPECIES: flagellar hook capping FlgD N-terminal domain-containing protein [Cohaesibacter]TLP48167.1 flagellar hook assembly protein FlgD [Cohaesibacter sp. CAU 1516]
MTTIGNITSQAVSNSAQDKTGLVQNYETFLTLLTTQLQNQDPMEPMDSSKFTEQLVQFSAIEQQIKSNEQLENLANMMTSSNALGVLNFVGTTVTVDGSRGNLSSYGSVDYSLESESAGSAEITIRNDAGDIVYNEADVSLTEGQQTFKWDGTDSSGNRMAPGTYWIQINAKDAEGAAISVDTDMTGVVDNVDLSSSQPMLIINGKSVPTSQIKSVARPTDSGTA